MTRAAHGGFSFGAIREAIGGLDGYGTVLDRQALPTATGRWLVMAGLDPSDRLVTKLVHVRAGSELGRPTVTGSVIVLDQDGAPQVLDAEALTVARTAAVSALATDRLARRDASVLAIYGTGALARPHVEAIGEVRPLEEVRVVGRTAKSAERLAAELRDARIPARAAAAAEALDGADIVTTVTTSRTPVFADEHVPDGVHVNAMGAFLPTTREIPGATIGRATVVVDSHAAARSGDIRLALAEGHLTDRPFVELLEHERCASVRRSPHDVTVFKSVGHIAFDVAAVLACANY